MTLILRIRKRQFFIGNKINTFAWQIENRTFKNAGVT